MQEICLFCFFILGLTAGSFLHAAAISIPDAFPIVRTWRCCGHCHSSLPVSALIPPLNWLIWRGKCPVCAAPCSRRSMVTELLAGILFVLCGLTQPSLADKVGGVLLICLLILVALIDLDTMEIPDRLPALILLLALIRMMAAPSGWPDQFAGALIVSVPFWFLYRLQAMGGGDVKLMFAAGMLLGVRRIVTAFLISLGLGSLAALILLLFFGANRRTEIPFGPFLAAGLIFALLFPAAASLTLFQAL